MVRAPYLPQLLPDVLAGPAGPDADLVEDVPEMEFDGLDADKQLGCHFAVRPARGDEAGHGRFGRSQVPTGPGRAIAAI
jgi:hypothetical protein